MTLRDLKLSKSQAPSFSIRTIKRGLETGEGSRQSFIKIEAPRKGCYDRRPRGAGNEIGIVGGENHEGQ
jgi:hypothetical protein